MLAGLKISKKLGIQHLKVYSDSQLIIDHVYNKYDAQEKNMKKYLSRAKDLSGPSLILTSSRSPRWENV